ncbi:MAG TPA: OsmC family protein [Chitinophagaceae bacterium]|nr:OsmC family protein [Chitinophagaceae bacterium]
MTEMQKIKLAVERTTKALSLKPSLGQSTGVSKARIKNGLTCEIHEGNWKFLADMPAAVGGNTQGPTPGVYGRAALGSCLAIGYMMAAAKKDIPITMLEVEVQADYDDGALFGTANVFPGYSEVRYTITIESEAPEEDVLKMLDEADQHSPYLDVFSRAQHCKREVRIAAPKDQS